VTVPADPLQGPLTGPGSAFRARRRRWQVPDSGLHSLDRARDDGACGVVRAAGHLQRLDMLRGVINRSVRAGAARLPKREGTEHSVMHPPCLRADRHQAKTRFGNLRASMGQPRDRRHRGIGKGLVSGRDLNPHVRDLRLCVPGPYREAHNRRSGACMCVRGPTRTLRT
jgi:hypothetical protein